MALAFFGTSDRGLSDEQHVAGFGGKAEFGGFLVIVSSPPTRQPLIPGDHEQMVAVVPKAKAVAR